MSTLGDALRLGQITCRLMVRQIDTPRKKTDPEMTFLSLSPGTPAAPDAFSRAVTPAATTGALTGGMSPDDPPRHPSARTGNNGAAVKPQSVDDSSCE